MVIIKVKETRNSLKYCVESTRVVIFIGMGNISMAAEFNFYVDPEAAFIVLNSFNCAKTILPWEGCLEDSICIPLVIIFFFKYGLS